ncbi:MAG: DUF5711 family protein [Oscillospiraceae bacterium]|nr:DUF5711 family protein [Oscillospiraceae bacterium]
MRQGRKPKALDEVTAARRKRRRKYHLRRLYFAVATLATVFVIAVVAGGINVFTFRGIGDYLSVAFAKDEGYPVMLESAKPLKLLPMKRALAVLTERELLVKGNRGAELLRIGHNYSSPAMRSTGNRILLFDSGNYVFSVYNRTSRLSNGESEYPIISGDIASDGTAVILTRGERTVSQLRVLSGRNYSTLFSWQGAKGFPYGCGISENAKQAYISALTAVRGGVDTIFTAVDIAKKEQRAEIQIPGIVIRVYESASKYIVLTDKGAFLINDKFEMEASYQFSRMPVIGVSKEGGLLAVAFGDNQQPDINYVVILTEKLAPVKTVEGVGPVDDMYMATDKLYLLSAGNIHVLLPDGERIGTYETELRAGRVFLMNSRVYVLLPDRIDQPELTGE